MPVVPFGDVDRLKIDNVDWHVMDRPTIDDAHRATTSWWPFLSRPFRRNGEALLADAAVQGRMVYQVKQLQDR